MHSGEIEIAKKMGLRYEPVDRRYDTSMPAQHMTFFSLLPYFIFGNLDSQGRPWVSIITGEQGFITATSPNNLEINVDANKWDPVIRNLQVNESKYEEGDRSTLLFSGLGVDFSNRRRNKVAGEIEPGSIKVGNGDSRVNVKMIANTKESLGNCPKYINIRSVKHFKRENAKVIHDHFNVPANFDGLPKECADTILQADTMFIATLHMKNSKDLFPISDMDVNIRGGPKSFIRIMPGGKQIIWPDYSGNRFYQSLGNVESDHKIGMVFPNFENGDMLYVTGEAENIFGDDASSLLPSCNLVTLVTITGFVFIKSGLDIIQTNEEISYSPYNPPVRYLLSESSLHPLSRDPASYPIHISEIQKISSNINKYTFSLPESSSPVHFIPGQHVLIDFSKVIPKKYSHMNEDKPQRLNDDFVRSWTISSSPSFSSSSSSSSSSNLTTISCTIKLKEKGEITPLLHYYASMPESKRPPLSLSHRGISGSFSIYKFPSPSLSLTPSLSLSLENENMLFIAGGIGVTPFLSFLSSLQQLPDLHPNIILLFSGRGDELVLANNFFTSGESLSLNPLISEIRLFQTGTTTPTEQPFPDVQQRRMTKSDLEKVDNLQGRTTYICGPDNFMKDINKWLAELGVDPERVKQERFDF